MIGEDPFTLGLFDTAGESVKSEICVWISESSNINMIFQVRRTTIEEQTEVYHCRGCRKDGQGLERSQVWNV